MISTEEQERIDHFEKLCSKLVDLDDEALKARSWELCHQVMGPVVELACIHTTPLIGRSVLLHMGIDSVTMHAIVENVLNAELLGRGAGHVVLCLSGRDGIGIRAVVVAIADDPVMVAGLFEEKWA